ncbi:MAG: hypothetical protein H6563_02655 [Lewinellaceae bacterium]|nr:hypothetical protein [Lewinellaceae bacterium]
MPNIRYLKIRFDQNIFPYDIPRFRAAVIEKTQRESDRFHNHKGEKEYLYRYPLIQYKVTDKKASILCLEEATDDIHMLLQNRDLDLRVGDRTASYAIEHIDLHYHQVQTWDRAFHYSLLNWQALNQKFFLRYHELEDDLPAQIDLLESILRGHILAFATGIGWHVEDRITAKITQVKQIKALPFKGKDIWAFTLNFKTNVSLPNFIGLGKGSSVGFGVVKEIGGDIPAATGSTHSQTNQNG